jgi:hypothetical protein
MVAPVLVETDDSGAASGLPASGDSAGVQPVIAIAAMANTKQMDLLFMIHPHGCYSGIVNVAATYQAISGVTKRVTNVCFGPVALVQQFITRPAAFRHKRLFD